MGHGDLCVSSVAGAVLVLREVKLPKFTSCLMRETERSVSSRDIVTGGRAIAVSVSVEAHSYRTCLSSRHLGDARDAPEDRAGRPASLLSQRL